jgi:hypothetical protein
MIGCLHTMGLFAGDSCVAAVYRGRQTIPSIYTIKHTHGDSSKMATVPIINALTPEFARDLGPDSCMRTSISKIKQKKEKRFMEEVGDEPTEIVPNDRGILYYKDI